MEIPFNVPYITGKEQEYIRQSIENRHFSGDGYFSKKCENFIEKNISTKRSLLTTSCTAALEMAAILLDIQPGDEVIMPSYTFVSTANAFVLRGAIPVFIDIRPDTLNIDETKIVAAITPKTKAIVVVHYAGVACEMDTIMQIAKGHGLYVVEDAAQALMSKYKGKPLGSIGHLSAFSFHATKNVICGEGGALCINDPIFQERSEIIREKGTNRKKFIEGQVDKYTWVDIGSSFLTNEITAAFLLAQLEEAANITNRRVNIWNKYLAAFSGMKEIRTPMVPRSCEHNAHIFYLLFSSEQNKLHTMRNCKKRNIGTTTHYVPLHTSPLGERCGRSYGGLTTTIDLHSKILRLPLYPDVADKQEYIIDQVKEALELSHTVKEPQ